MRLLKFLRRCAAYWHVRSLEIELNDKRACLKQLSSADCLAREIIKLSLCRLEGELVTARAHYNSLLPPGKRMTWEHA